ncbi:MAG TPA: methyl-accepting chemotaxis protein [Methanospirillum sp.]|nr:methyl-accepting chemotaxis protein [Methanospirillum sp.]
MNLNIFSRMKSIKQKILFGGGIALLIVAVSLIAYAGTSAYGLAIENAKSDIQDNAIKEAALIEADLEAPLADSRALAEAFAGVRAGKADLHREDTILMVNNIIASNAEFRASGTIWEPNTYTDAGDDATYAGKDGYEADGRMRIMFLRDDTGTVKRHIYDPKATTEPGEYYSLPKERLKEVVTEPMTNPSLGRNKPFISSSAPIIVDGKFMGVFYNDVLASTLDDIIDQVNLYDNQAIAVLISEKGQVIGVQTKYDGWLGKYWGDANIPFVDPTKIAATEKAYRGGEITTNEAGGFVKSVIPFTIGETGTHWAVIIAVPTSVVTTTAVQTVMYLIIVGLIMSLIGLAVLYYVARSIAAPIVEVTGISEKMALGDIDLDISYESHDEVGKLADSFRSMIANFKGKSAVSTALSMGDLNVTVPVASDKDTLGLAMTQMKEAITGMVTTVKRIATAAEAGQLKERGDATQFKGEYQNIITGLNNTLDSVINPVNEAMRLSGSYAKGDYTDRISDKLSVKGDFIPFKEALNQIGIAGSSAIGGVKSEVESLTAGMEETNASAEEVASTTSMLAQSSNSVSVLAERSGSGIKQTLTAMEDLSNTVSSVATKAEQASSMAKQTVDLSEKGVLLAGKAEKGMEGIMQSVDETSVIITDITSQMEEIGKIVDVITGIAEQTGLLALNAAIEAARAGDAGMGFAVVADEVKSLALESQKSAENIASIIGNLQKKSQKVSESMKVSATEVKAGNDAVTETLGVFNQIVQSINVVHNNMTEVAGATEEQAAAVEEITASVHEVGSLVQQTAKEAVDSAAATEEVTASIDQITRAISEAAASVQKISGEMGKFTVS